MGLSISVNRLAALLDCPEENVAAYWPVIQQCLEPPTLGLNTPEVAIAALATVAVETAHKFQAIDEFGDAAYFTRLYDVTGERPNVARSMGNTEPGDGVKYHGRGLVQISWKSNYEHYGRLIGVDLVANPEEAKALYASCAILAAYFYDHRIHGKDVGDAARAKDWVGVRKLVNGGTNGMEDFLACVARLEAERLAAAVNV